MQPPACRKRVSLLLGFLSEEASVELRRHAPVGKMWHGPGACGFRGGADRCPLGIGVGMRVCAREELL